MGFRKLSHRQRARRTQRQPTSIRVRHRKPPQLPDQQPCRMHYPSDARPDDDEVIGRVSDHHQQTDRPPPVVASGAYRAEVLETLLGNAGRAC